jgi:hypothetical protein
MIVVDNPACMDSALAANPFMGGGFADVSVWDPKICNTMSW